MTIILFIKYEPVYKVTIGKQEIGYTKNKKEIQKAIEEYIYDQGKNVAFVIDENLPQFNLIFTQQMKEVDEQEIIEQVKNTHIATYKNYAIVLDGEDKIRVNTLDEAIEVVNELEEDVEEKLDMDLGIKLIYTDNIETTKVATVEVAKVDLDSQINKKVEILGRTVNGVTLSQPLNGVITSRYGVMSRIRSGAHTGLDIAASTGTPIKACAEGTVIHAGLQGAYGNLVIIEHENDVQTYYAHCSKILVKQGDRVNENSVIANVGSTGNSTGPHLHLEIRVNGKTLNPQNYLYK